MHRRSMRSALVLVAVAALTLAACGSKSTDSDIQQCGGAGGQRVRGGVGQRVRQRGRRRRSDDQGRRCRSTPDGNEVAGRPPAAPRSARPATARRPAPAGTTIAMAGALTGPNAALGINILNGAKVAIDEHNKANPNCQVHDQAVRHRG